MGSQGGQDLFAHELTHVVQRHGGTVQRLLDGFYQPKNVKVKKERISLSDAFTEKHVADNNATAGVITRNRVNVGNAPLPMVNGVVPNTTATSQNWINSIDKSKAVIPDQKEWVGDLPIKITGWDVTYNAGPPVNTVVAAINNQARTVGGFMKQKGGDVTIDHVAN